MSRVGVRSLASSCSTPAPSLGRVAPRLLAMSVDAVTDLLQGVAGLVGPALSGLTAPGQGGAMSLFPRSDCGCTIPEADCPPRCVCEITWEATRGEKLRCTVRVTNTSAKARTFTIAATGFTGPAGSAAGPDVSPQQLQLAGGGSGLVDAGFAVPDELQDGEYVAEIVVRGAYEQCVCVLLHVTSKQKCPPGNPSCRCEVRQGDPPVRVRAHHWYDHFQCSEPCPSPERRDPRPDREKEPA